MNKRLNKGLKGIYNINYARGERNGMAKLTDNDVVLMLEFKDSCQDDIDRIDKEIEALKNKKAQLKKQISKRYIADMFDISESHCYGIFNGSKRIG